ncbi:MAG: site-specific DNA-methyltransferase [Chloroflexi bacterium]|nr:site-specific DNA-methyltransferase [Chloroflexota bacterium]MBP8055816.1 site-specific DNA-methyltransferase [Chloroflexota bacterium]
MTEQKIVLGDALEKISDFPSEFFDLIIADPPYNLGKDYGNNHDIKGFDDYLDFSRRWIGACQRVLKSNGTIYVFMGFRFISYLYDILDREYNFFFNNWIVWHYTQGMGKTRGFSPRHDDVLMFTKGKDFVFNLDDVRVPQKYYRDRNNMRGANPGDVWEFSHVHYSNGNRQEHPTQKPEGLMERMVLASSNSGDWVLDPFSGSGTTLRVCQQLQRNGVGIEINPDYVTMTQKRLATEFSGFDTIDPRMERIPFDLRRDDIREAYLENHKKWFLQNHENALQEFEASVDELYGQRKIQQLSLLESKADYD